MAKKGLCQHFVRLPTARQKNIHAFLDFLFQAVTEIVMHLGDEFVVTERIQIDIIGISHRQPRPGWRKHS